MIITIVAGARPNFMKIAPIIRAIHSAQANAVAINYRLVHTGQHYDKNLSQSFFDELQIPEPDVNLNVGSGTQAEQTASIMIAFEKDLQQHPCDLVLVVGDVTSTMACTIVAKKAGIKVAHIEAGIRSGDLQMPEEINRIVTDSLTDYYFTTSTYANDNLLQLGVKNEAIFYVGNVMIDTLRQQEINFKAPEIWHKVQLQPKSYLVMTLHRPSNVDAEHSFKQLIDLIVRNSNATPIIFPVHPRTRKIFDTVQIQYENLHLIDPLGYLEFNYLVKHALGVLTDSGGITEETTVLNVPCITLRENTERPETCNMGTNVLVGKDEAKLAGALQKLLTGDWKSGQIPELWDGKAAERIVSHIIEIFDLQ